MPNALRSLTAADISDFQTRMKRIIVYATTVYKYNNTLVKAYMDALKHKIEEARQSVPLPPPLEVTSLCTLSIRDIHMIYKSIKKCFQYMYISPGPLSIAVKEVDQLTQEVSYNVNNDACYHMYVTLQLHSDVSISFPPILDETIKEFNSQVLNNIKV